MPVELESVDVEVRLREADGSERWVYGYLYRRDWRRSSGGRWECFVRYSTTHPEGWAETFNGFFDQDDIRQL